MARKNSIKILCKMCDWKIYLLLVYGLCTSNAHLLVEPHNTEAVVGEKVVFNCTTSVKEFSINWQHRPVGATRPNEVFASRHLIYPYHERFKIEGNSFQGQYDLIIASVSWSDAGMYSCTERAGQGEGKEFEFNVLEAPPRCETPLNLSSIIGENDCRIDPDIIHFNCNLNYTGNLVPQLNWMLSNDKLIIPKNLAVVEKQSNQVTITAEFDPDVDFDGRAIILETSLSRYGWTSEIIKILSLFNNSNTTQDSNEATQVCTITNTTRCSYRWVRNIETGFEVISFNQSLTPHNSGVYRCLAECLIRGNICTLEPMVLHINPKDCISQSIRFALSSLVSLSIVVSILTILVLFYKKKFHKWTWFKDSSKSDMEKCKIEDETVFLFSLKDSDESHSCSNKKASEVSRSDTNVALCTVSNVHTMYILSEWQSNSSSSSP